MKKILLSISIFFCCAHIFGQQFTTPRTNPTVTVQDSRMRPLLNFYLPHTHGLTLNGGLDTLGLMEYEDSSGHVWYRDTIPSGGHQWRMQVRFGDVVSGVSSFNTRAGAVTLGSADVTTALGYTPVNANGLSSQYIAANGSFVAFPAIPAQINITDAGLFSHSGTYPNYTFSSATPTQQQTFTAGSTLTGNNFWVTGSNVLGMTGTSAFGLPTGTTSQRPGSPVAGYTRFNTDSAAQETFNGSIWVKAGTGTGFTGVSSFNTRTGAVTLSSGDVTTALGYTPVNANGLSSEYIAGNGSFVAFPAIPAQINITDAGLFVHTGTYPNYTFTGTIPTFQQTLIAGSTMTGNNTVSTGTFNFLFSGTSALGLPSGNTAQRPGSPSAGWTRFNTDSAAQETFNGSIWVKAGSSGGGSSGVSSFNTRTGAVTLSSGDVTTALGFTPIQFSSLSANAPILYNGSGLFSLDTTAGATHAATQGFVNNQGFLKANQTITLTGPVTGSGTTSITTTITPVISSGSCTNCNLTYNAAGQLIVAASGSGGTGGTNSNVGIGYWIANAGTNNIKTFLSGYGGSWDSLTANVLRYTVDSTKFIPYTDTLKPGGIATQTYVNAQGFLKTAPVTSVGSLSPLFTSSSTGAVSFTLSNAAANTVFGNFTGSSAAPGFGKVTLASLATNTANTLIGFDASGNPVDITAGSGVAISAGVISATGGGTPDTIFVKYLGVSGDTLVKASGTDTLTSVRIRDSSSLVNNTFHHLVNGGGDWTLWAVDSAVVNGYGITQNIVGTTKYLFADTASTHGLVSKDYFAARVITLTTTGTSGPATLSGTVLNIPQYSGGGGGSFITNLGSGYILLNYNSQGVKSLTTDGNITLDSLTTNQINFTIVHPSTRPTSTVSAPTTFTLNAGDIVEYIWVDPTSATSNFQVGTTSTGSDVISTRNLIAGSANNWFVGYRATATTTLYFQGISSSTVVTLIKLQ
jgi:hypothetical protein